MASGIIALLTFIGLVLSIYLLKITQNDIWFFSFLIFLALFCLKLADWINDIRPDSDDLLPVAVHVFAVLLFMYGIYASYFSWNHPEAELWLLIGGPFMLSLSPYLALMLYVGPQVIILKSCEFAKRIFRILLIK